jgi:3-dehydrotetronate 4-kinase
MPILLGCIADDFTGATDLAGTLVKQGLRTVQIIDDPRDELPPTDADAVVVALKSRTSPVESAVKESLSALEWLRAAGCRQYYFKYCSTFDSTPKGNIGPVAEALMDAIGAAFTIACPAFPDNRRTVYQGNLFVGSELLSESSMRHHPLTPMSDANLVRVLGAQVKRRVGLIDFATVREGAAAIRKRIAWLREQGVGFAIADALANEDLETLGEASADLELLTGASGLALGLPANFRRAGMVADGIVADALPKTGGPRAVIAGSCSAATQKQVAIMQERNPALRLDLAALRSGDAVERALAWASGHIGKEPVLIYSTAAPQEVKAIQEQMGEAASSALIEKTLAEIARRLVGDLGVRRLIVAGGETSGAVVKALGVKRLQIGSEICPGVPWTAAKLERDGGALALALKSGNFGAPDFFLTAWDRLP